MTKETVNHPDHYGGADNPYEVIKVILAWGLDKSYALGNAVKYIARAGKKDPAKLLEDLRKAQWYLNWEIEKLDAEQSNEPSASHRSGFKDYINLEAQIERPEPEWSEPVVAISDTPIPDRF